MAPSLRELSSGCETEGVSLLPSLPYGKSTFLKEEGRDVEDVVTVILSEQSESNPQGDARHRDLATEMLSDPSASLGMTVVL